MKNFLIKYFHILFISTCFITTSWGQSQSVKDFRDHHKTEQTLFFYPSTLRMINLDKDPDFYQLVQHVNKLQFLTFDKKENPVEAEAIQKLRKDIQKENYEELLTMDNKGNNIHIYGLGDANEDMVGVIDNSQTLTLLDLDGYVDMTSLIKLMQGNFSFGRITNLMETVGKEQKTGPKKPDQK